MEEKLNFRLYNLQSKRKYLAPDFATLPKEIVFLFKNCLKKPKDFDRFYRKKLQSAETYTRNVEKFNTL